MAFEKFTRTRGRVDTPKVSIWSRGQIGFNKGALDEFSLGKYKYAALYYDKENDKIGVEFTNDEKSEGISKMITRKGAGTSISALAFLKHYKIDFSETTKYDLEYDKENKLYVVDLRKKKK